MEKKYWIVGTHSGDISPRYYNTEEARRRAALDLDGDCDEIKRFESQEEASEFLKTCKNEMRQFRSHGMLFYYATVYWMYEIIVDEDGEENYGDWLESADWEEQEEEPEE